MERSRIGWAALLSAVLLAAVAGCEAKKSENPLSPSVAGPIPGVDISAPAVVEPANGYKFRDTEQPIRLTIQNSATTGVRPLSYAFEVATDNGFSTKVFSRAGVTPGTNGRTSVQLDLLAIGQKYYWRVRAEDGANSGPYSASAFEIYPKPSLAPPTPVSPINGEQQTTSTPTLVVTNSQWAGPVGGLSYEFQVATDQAFTQLASAGVTPEGNGTTSFKTVALVAGKTMFWRARSSDGSITSGWSATQTFKTPAAVTPPPGGGGGGGGGGSCALPTGPQIVACIAAKYPDKRAPVGSLSQRQANMQFLRDRIIEAGKCAGMDYGWNLKRGGPELSIDVIAWKRPDGNMGVDIAFDYDNIGSTLQLTWGEIDLFASYTPYTNSFSCGS